MMADHERNANQPLAGLHVLDLTRLLPGPLCTLMMGDYGAEVIKVEDIHAGDPTRYVGRSTDGRGSFFRQLNRNKKSIAVNLKAEQGREILMKLAAWADILVEGFRPGVMERLGLGYAAMSAVNPRLIYAAISGYGQSGPYRERAGHDINYTALSGLLDLSAPEGGAPAMPAIQVADIAGGSLMALSGILMALFARQQSGKGSYIDISMTRGLLPWFAFAATGLGGGERLPRRGQGYITGAFACYNLYETGDGKYMSLGALEPVFWKSFCMAVEKPHWIQLQFEPQGREDLIKEVQTLFKEKTREHWVQLFSGFDACCEPVLDLHEALEHPVNRADHCWIDAAPGQVEDEKQTGFPLLFSGNPGELRLPPPFHSEHTTEILQSLGYETTAILSLKADGIIV